MVPSPSRQEYLLCGVYGINVKGYACLSMALFQQVNQFIYSGRAQKKGIPLPAPRALRSAKLFRLPFRFFDESEEEKSSTNGVCVSEALLLTGLWLLFLRPFGAASPFPSALLIFLTDCFSCQLMLHNVGIYYYLPT